MKKGKVTIEDVANEAGVSISTVSRVLNNNYPVSPETRDKVNKAIKKLNFNPNIVARSLIMKRTQTIGIVVPSLDNMFFTTVVKGVEEICKSCRYTILLTNSESSGDEELKCVRNLISRQVDGIIVIDPQTDNMKLGCFNDIVKELPLVFINGYNHGLNYNFVRNDERGGTVKALEYLVGLGHKRIAFVRGYKSYSYDIKEEVYREIMSAHNLPVNNDFIINIGEGNSVETVDNACRAVSLYMESLYEKNINMPTAFFACNDLMAIGILNACKKLSIKVPEDVSIIGFDNIMLSQLCEPKLTTVDQNMVELGRRAAEIIINYSERGSNFNRIILNTKLIKRGSCKPV